MARPLTARTRRSKPCCVVVLRGATWQLIDVTAGLVQHSVSLAPGSELKKHAVNRIWHAGPNNGTESRQSGSATRHKFRRSCKFAPKQDLPHFW